MNHPEHNRNDGSPIIVGAFTLEEIKQANRKHDAEMGWSDNMSRIYTNPKRLAETYCGPVEKIWDKTEKICQGPELESVLAGIRERGGFVDRLETCFGGHNAMYRVNYFERAVETPMGGKVMGTPCQVVLAKPALTNQVTCALNPFPFACGDCDPCLGGRPDQCAIFPTKKVPHQVETPLPHCPTCSGPVTQGVECPICAGLERIRDGARKLRDRFRPSTREARTPHND